LLDHPDHAFEFSVSLQTSCRRVAHLLMPRYPLVQARILGLSSGYAGI
jgi:hypothetical protein